MRFVALKTGIMFPLLLTPDFAVAETWHRLKPIEAEAGTKKISEFGKYQVYSKAIYDSWVRLSVYVSVRDRGKLATDIMIPAIDCQRAKEPLPVLWTYTPYKRAYPLDGVAIMGADADNTENLVFQETPTINVFRNSQHSSNIVLPIQQ